MTSALFSPYKINGLELANRINVAPMCQYSAADGVIGDWHMTHLGMLANSGAGLVFVEMSDVERRGRITHGCVGIYSDDCEAAFKRVIDHCKRIGTAKFGIQIAHAGRKASSQKPWEGGRGLKPDQDPWETIGPSAIPFGADWPPPRQMSEEDIAHVRDAYVNGAKRALRVGFDAIQLHMAHGYLIHAFTSPISNRRNDRYGGDLAGRMSFSLEVVRAIRSSVPKDYPLGARISAVDWVDGGLTVDDAVKWVAP
jgi:NADPH2 dehydrogenase